MTFVLLYVLFILWFYRQMKFGGAVFESGPSFAGPVVSVDIMKSLRVMKINLFDRCWPPPSPLESDDDECIANHSTIFDARVPENPFNNRIPPVIWVPQHGGYSDVFMELMSDE